jgi:hypothetical protein
VRRLGLQVIMPGTRRPAPIADFSLERSIAW